MSKDIGFEFPVDQSGQWDGFNDSGMEHFAGNPLEHLGREVVQNTMDARNDKTKPSCIEIEITRIKTSEIPNVSELKAVIKCCRSQAAKESSKAKTFFEQANSLIAKDHIDVLKISDFNTTGVAGPCENGTPYFAFMKATGQSKKSSEDATGSFGIGKFAPYTVSGLRTVFVSTVWNDGSKPRHYTQGKSILMSHVDGKITCRGTGYWGFKTRCQPVSEEKHLPTWLRRPKDTGTTLNVLGFRSVKNWQQILAANIAENFFGAIHGSELEVHIGDGLKITKKNLAKIFADSDVKAAVADQGEPEKFDNAKEYVRALSDSTEVIVERSQQLHLGLCEIRLIVGEGLPKKVAVLRNGMLITEELPGLRRFGDYKEFVAVVQCHSGDGNALLRAMEPPRHDNFEPDRLPDDAEKAKGKLALIKLAKWVKEVLKARAQDPVSSVTNIDELADFFGDEDTEGTSNLTEENPSGSVTIRARQLKLRSRSLSSEERDSEDGEGEGDTGTTGGGTGDGGGGGGKGGGDAPGKGKGNTGGKQPAAAAGIMLGNVRAIPTGPARRRIAFTPETSGMFHIQIQDSGADTNTKLHIRKTSQGMMKDGEITKFKVSAGKRVIFDVELDHPFEGTLRVVANAI